MDTDTETPEMLGIKISVGEETIVDVDGSVPTTTSYPVYLDPLRIGTSSTTGETDPDAVAVFRYEKDGMVNLEAFSSLVSIYPLAGPRRDVRTRLRPSVPESRQYLLLMQDIGIEVAGVDGRLVFEYKYPKPAEETLIPSTGPSIASQTTFRPPQVQVMHTMSVYESLPESGIITPTAPLSALDETKKVYETPAVKSRHIDPSSSHRRRPKSPTSTIKKGGIVHSKSGLMRGGEPDALDLNMLSDSEDEGMVKSTVEPIAMNDVDGIMAPTPTVEISQLQQTDGVVTPSGTPKRSTSKTTSPSNLQDSLPDVFKYREQQKINTPAKTYGRRKAKGSAEKKTTVSPVSKPSEPDSQETADSTPPQTINKKSSDGRKRKSRQTLDESEDEDMQISEIMKKRKGADGAMLPPAKTEATSKPKRGGRKKIAESEGPEKAVLEPVDLDDSPVEEAPSKAGPKTAASKKKETTKPAPKARGRKATLTQESSSKNNTQYTFPYNSGEEESTPPVAPKTPKARGKAATKKTPAKPSAPATAKKAAKAVEVEIETAGKDVSPELSNLRTTDHYEGPSPRIAFTNSSIPDDKAAQKFLRTNGGKQLASPALTACNFLVIGPGELKRTPKFIVAVAHGIMVVEEQWVLDSKTAGYWVDPDPYILRDPIREKEWKFKLSDAIQRGKDGKNKVLTGKTVYLTAALVAYLKSLKSEESLVEMLNAAGAQSIIKKSPRGEQADDEDDSLVLGNDGDKELANLQAAGWSVYGTTIVGFSVLRGRLQDGEEFLVKPTAPSGSEEPVKKRGSRK
ncbi:hypothetical protein EDC01DRAFT_679167 [Geopyxis carbonaria]|nr:hypothetical protein EDC01DRAFT_679167 [Geopyxis carbonaria]